MRLPYAPGNPPLSATSSTRDTYRRIASRRHPRPLIPLDLTLLHSPGLADGYNTFVGAIRTDTSLPADILELAVCRVAVLTNAVWEWEAHSKLAVQAGVQRSVLEQVLSMGKNIGNETRWGEPVSELQKAFLNYTDEVTVNNEVNDVTWAGLQHAFEGRGWREKELVELTVVIAGYNMVSRILVPLNVGERNGIDMEIPHGVE